MPASQYPLPYADVPEDALIKIQAEVSRDDKRTIFAALGTGSDVGITSFIVQSTFKNIATFIRQNGLNKYDISPTERAVIIDFVRNCADPRAAKQATTHPESGRSEGGKQTASRVPRKSATAR